MIDLRHYEKYNVRPLYHKYGGKVLLDDKKIISVEYEGEVYPHDHRDFDKNLKIFTGTFSIEMARSHAGFTHLFTAQKIYTRVTRDLYNSLSDAEKEFYAISLYRTNDINSLIHLYIGNNGLLYRLYAFDHESFLQLVSDFFHHDDYKDDESTKKYLLGTPGTYWNRTVTGYYNLIVEFLEEYLGKDSHIPIITVANFFFSVTLLHEAVGDSQLRLMLFNLINRTHKTNVDIRTREYVDINITSVVSVGTRTPKLVSEDYRDSIIKDKRRREIWDNFITKCLGLRELQDDQRIKFSNFEISVGF